MQTAISSRLLSAARMPMTRSTSPAAESTAPDGVERPRRIRRHRVLDRARLSKMMIATISAWKTNAARQLIAVVMRPPISGPAAAPMPPMPLITPNARARDVTSVKSIVVRM